MLVFCFCLILPFSCPFILPYCLLNLIYQCLFIYSSCMGSLIISFHYISKMYKNACFNVLLASFHFNKTCYFERFCPFSALFFMVSLPLINGLLLYNNIDSRNIKEVVFYYLLNFILCCVSNLTRTHFC